MNALLAKQEIRRNCPRLIGDHVVAQEPRKPFFLGDMDARTLKSWMDNFQYLGVSSVIFMAGYGLKKTPGFGARVPLLLMVMSSVLFMLSWAQSCFMAISLVPNTKMPSSKILYILYSILLVSVCLAVPCLLLVIDISIFIGLIH